MSAAAPMVEIKEVNDFMVRVLSRPSRKVPLFKQGHFGSTGL